MSAVCTIVLLTLQVASAGPAPSEQRPWVLAEPVRLAADGAVIDTGRDAGYAGPLVHDYDGDGLPDLLVGSIAGTLRYFQNTGTRTAPELAEQDPPEAGGEPIRIHNW